jgi:hypothetical protein
MHYQHSILFRLSSVFLVAAILFGITGFTMQKHICNCRNEIVYSIFPELFGSQVSCCCSVDKKINNKTDGNVAISNPDGCKDVHLFYKDPSVTILTTSIIIDLKTPVAEFILNDLLLNIPETTSKIITSLYRPPPLLLYGQSLLRFIQELKIPSTEM